MLEELGLEYEHVPTSFLGGETRTPEFLAVNPNGHIPTLVDGDVTLFESMAINLYLAEKYDGGLRPKTVEDRGRATQWSFWVMTECELSVVEFLFNTLVLPEESRDGTVAAAAAEKLAGPFAVLDAALADREFLVGDAFGVADVNVASVLGWVVPGGFDFAAFPNLKRWLHASMGRPAAKAAQSK
jgi:glutathione S-transferase